MAYIYSLKIEHYRGIDHFEQIFGDEKFVMLIGRGDSGKTTILHAIESVLCPNWNMNFSDMDFNKMDVSKPIIIEAVIGDAPSDLLSIDKYGQYYCILKDGQIQNDITDEDANQDDIVLKVKLVVDDSLEPKWYISSGRPEQEDIVISASDRSKLNMFMVSDYVDNHFSYNRMSPLHALLKRKLDDKDSPEKKLVALKREIASLIEDTEELDEFDCAIKELISSAGKWGLDLTNLKTSFDIVDKSYTESDISLHKDNIPYKFHGKGSKRLLSMSIQNELTKSGGVILIDEIEQGLEPDRIVSLVHLLKNNKQGQIFITTHSSYALVEAEAHNIFMMKEGADKLISFNKDFQNLLRTKPEAFFAKKIICCEGKTEEGIIRAIEEKLRNEKGISLPSLGIAIVNCKGGGEVTSLPMNLKKCDFDVCVFCDMDVERVKNEIPSLKEKLITCAVCADGFCLEKQICSDLPWDDIIEFLKLAKYLNTNSKSDLLTDAYINSLAQLVDTDKQIDERGKIGAEACGKENAWFKDIDKGISLGHLVMNAFDTMQKTSTLYLELNTILQWIGVDSYGNQKA